MQNEREDLLGRNLKVEVEAALSGESSQSVVLLQRPDRLPRALVTDEAGVVHSRVITYVDLLGTLERSITIEQLEREPQRRLPLEPMPSGTLLVDLIERATQGSNSYVITGVLPARSHLVTLSNQHGFMGEEEAERASTYEIELPPVFYRALYNERQRNVTELSVALLSPKMNGDEPTPRTPVYRYPFSNVYSTFSGVLEGVCWYQKQDIRLAMQDLPQLVRRFVSIPNDPARYTRDLTHNAPHKGYAEFLEAIEKGGGIPHEWLVPAGMSIQELHDQESRED